MDPWTTVLAAWIKASAIGSSGEPTSIKAVLLISIQLCCFWCGRRHRQQRSTLWSIQIQILRSHATVMASVTNIKGDNGIGGVILPIEATWSACSFTWHVCMNVVVHIVMNDERLKNKTFDSILLPTTIWLHKCLDSMLTIHAACLKKYQMIAIWCRQWIIQ